MTKPDYKTMFVSSNTKKIEAEIERIANELAVEGREVVAVFTVPRASGIDGPGTSGQWFRCEGLCILHRKVPR